MTALDDLRKLGEFPAVDEYREYAADYEGFELFEKADAAIEELAGALAFEEQAYADAEKVIEHLAHRSERAEAQAEVWVEQCNHEESKRKRAEASEREMAETAKNRLEEVHRLREEVARLERLLDEAWTERRKRSVERGYNSGMRTKRQWFRTLATRYEEEELGN